MELDINIDIYPIDKGGEYRVLIVRSLGISQEMDQVCFSIYLKGKYKPDFA